MINHRYKFIFIHIPRTGGTSIETFFQILNRGPNKDINRKHFNLYWYKEKQPKNRFNKYFKFTFVRNPWDLMISKYLDPYFSGHCKRGPAIGAEAGKSLKYFLEHYKTPRHEQGEIFHDYFDPEEIDFIGRFENRTNDLEYISEKIGVPIDSSIHSRKVQVFCKKDYTSYYDDETRQMVAEKYERDINYFGYKFGEKAMKNPIFISTSSKYKLLNPDSYHHQIHHTHNTKEFIQYIQYIKGNLDIPSHLESKVFRSQYLQNKRKRPLISINRRSLLYEYTHSNTVVVEICSVKIYEEKGFYLHHLAVDSGDSRGRSENYKGNFRIQTDQELYDDLKIIKQMTAGKKLIIATHININKFPNRSRLIDTLSKFCQDLEISFYNASKTIKPEDTNDVNHLNDRGYRKITAALRRIIST